jgi:hypothetical protein
VAAGAGRLSGRALEKGRARNQSGRLRSAPAFLPFFAFSSLQAERKAWKKRLFFALSRFSKKSGEFGKNTGPPPSCPHRPEKTNLVRIFPELSPFSGRCDNYRK